MPDIHYTDGTLYLCTNVPLDPEYNYTIDFNSRTAQATYFDSLVTNTFTKNYDYKYLKTHKSIKVEALLDDIFACNYMFFDNGLTNSKRIYAFITEKHYINQNCTELFYDIDVMQTFFDDVTIGNCFVEREHQDRFRKMTIGGESKLVPLYNTNKENIDKGTDWIVNGDYNVEIPDNIPSNFDLSMTTHVFYWATVVCKEPIHTDLYHLDGTTNNSNPITKVKGISTNTYTYVIPICQATTNILNDALVKCTYKTNANINIYSVGGSNALSGLLGSDEKILSVNISKYSPFEYKCDKDTVDDNGITYTRYRLYPVTIVDTRKILLATYTVNGNSYGMYMIDLIDNATAPVLSISHNYTLSPYTYSTLISYPVGNFLYEPKLRTSDYSYWVIRLGGQSLKVKDEWLPPHEFKLKYIPSFSVKNGTAVVIDTYQNIQNNYDYMITTDSATFELPLRSDAWLSYLSQNKSSMVSGFTTSAIQTVAGIGLGLATGGLGLAVAGTQALSFAGNIANKIAQINDLKNTPDKINATTTDCLLDYVTRGLAITYSCYCLEQGYMETASKYFLHYGYKCNTFKVPNYRSRYYFNYLKTVGAVVNGNIDSIYKDKIRAILDNGVTIWHYRDSLTWKGVNNFTYENAEMSLT